MKKCPYCKEEIQDDAIKCRHCGEFLDRTQHSQASQPQKEKKKTGCFTIGCAPILILGLFIFIWSVYKLGTSTPGNKVEGGKATFHLVGWFKNDTTNAFTYFVENPNKKDIEAYTEEQLSTYKRRKKRLLWIDYYKSRAHTPDITLRIDYPPEFDPFHVASFHYNPFNGNKELIWLKEVPAQ